MNRAYWVEYSTVPVPGMTYYKGNVEVWAADEAHAMEQATKLIHSTFPAHHLNIKRVLPLNRSKQTNVPLLWEVEKGEES